MGYFLTRYFSLIQSRPSRNPPLLGCAVVVGATGGRLRSPAEDLAALARRPLRGNSSRSWPRRPAESHTAPRPHRACTHTAARTHTRITRTWPCLLPRPHASADLTYAAADRCVPQLRSGGFGLGLLLDSNGGDFIPAHPAILHWQPAKHYAARGAIAA